MPTKKPGNWQTGDRYTINVADIADRTIADVFGSEDLDVEAVDERLWQFLLDNGVGMDVQEPSGPSIEWLIPGRLFEDDDEEVRNWDFTLEPFNDYVPDVVNMSSVGRVRLGDVFGTEPVTATQMWNRLGTFIDTHGLRRSGTI